MKKLITSVLVLSMLLMGIYVPVNAEEVYSMECTGYGVFAEDMQDMNTDVPDSLGVTYSPEEMDTKSIYNRMIAKKEEYPEGMPWTNDDFYRWNGGYYYGGYGCAAFAFILSDAGFGDLPARILDETDFASIRVGDILRVNNDTHSVIVLEVYDDYVIVAEGNYNSSIHWGRMITKGILENGALTYIMTRYETDPESSATPEPESSATPEPESSATPEPEPSTTPAPEASTTPEPESSATPEPEPSTMPEPEASATPAPEASATPAPEPSTTPAPEASATPAPETSATPEPESSTTPAPEASATPAPEASATPEPETSATPEPESSATPEPEPSTTPEPEPSATPEPEPSATPEPEASVTPAPEVSATPEPEPSATPEPEASATPAPEVSATPEPEPSATPEPEPSTTPAPEPSATPEPEPSTTPEPETSATPEPEASATPEPETSATPEPEPSTTPAPEASATPEPEPSATPEPETSATPEPESSATPEPEPSTTPAPEASATPEPEASATPEPETSATPEPEASATPEPETSATPAPEPSITPSPVPSVTPEPEPSAAPEMIQLSAPTDLEWGTYHFMQWNDDYTENTWEETEYPGYISWKPGPLDIGKYILCVYREGESNPCLSVYWNSSAYFKTEWESVDYFCESDLESGNYYFTVTALGDGEHCTDSPTVTSEIWTYTKPEEKLGSCTNLTWEDQLMSWDAPAESEYLGGYELELYYAETKEDEPYCIKTTSWRALGTGCRLDHLKENDGYYYYKVRALSNDITVVSNGEWSQLSKSYALGVDPIIEFEDVEVGAYYEDPVQWAVEKGITNGYGSNDTFCPEQVCTRGQIVTFLWRAKGCPEPASLENPFTDVAEDAYYYKAVLWAVEQGITNGYGSETTFCPDEACTRGQVATFMWRAENNPEVSDVTNTFVDLEDGAYYYDAVLWAVENGVTNGYGSADTFCPEVICTRGQIVTFLYRGMN